MKRYFCINPNCEHDELFDSYEKGYYKEPDIYTKSNWNYYRYHKNIIFEEKERLLTLCMFCNTEVKTIED